MSVFEQAEHGRGGTTALAVDGRRATALWLGAIGLGAFGLLLLSARLAPRPSIFPDEFVYWRLQQSLADSGQFLLFGEHFSPWTFGILLPLLLAPLAWLPLSAPALYHLDQAVCCLLFATAVVPAYLLGRRLLTHRNALLLSALLVLLPSNLYATHLMTEGLGYPLFLWALLACWLGLERPGLRPQLLAFGSIVAASLTRAELAALLPAYLCALLVLRPQPRRRILIGSLVAAVAIVLALVLAGWGPLLGQHRSLFGRLSPAEAPAWMLANLVGVEVYVGVIPFVLAAIVVASWLGGTDTRRRNLAVLAIGLATWLLAVVGVYVTQRPSAGVYDRYTFYLAPLVLLAFADWLEHATGVSRRLQVVIVGLVLLPLAIPYPTIFTDTWGLAVNVGLLPLYAVHQGLDWPIFYPVLAVLLVGLAAAFLHALRHDDRRSLVVLSVGALAFLGFVAHATNAVVASNAGDCLRDPHWIERQRPAIRDAVVVWSGRDRHDAGCATWQSMFFNPELDRVYRVGPSLGSLREPRVTVSNGRVRLADGGGPLPARYVVSDLALAGTVLARDDPSRLRLYDLGRPE